MTLLPIVGRELRVAARKRSTFWLRVVTAIVGLIIGGASMLLLRVGGFGSPGVGSMMFGVLTWLSLFAAFAAGLFFTSDCLSEEKREGTLGFLFLTDLRGYDVVAGKLLATSLRGFYGLIALFPILAITLFAGGVTGVQVWKTSLALLNALFFSLSAGMLVSALSRDYQRAMAGTLLLLLLFFLGGPVADGLIRLSQGRSFVPLFSLSSPGYLFTLAGDWGRTPYWPGLLTTQIIAWLFFVLASIAIPRTWQERARKEGTSTAAWGTLKYGRAKRRSSLRTKLLDRNVVWWLVGRERWQSVCAWVVAALGAIVFGWLLIAAPRESWMVWNYLAGFFLLFIYLWAASQASRFFVEAGRSGLTELLLTTPLKEKDMVLGHWQGLLRMFGGPILIILCMYVIGAAFSTEGWRKMATQAGAAAAAAASNAASNSVTSTNGGSTTTTVVSTKVTSFPVSSPGTKVGVPSVGSMLLAVGTSGLPAIANLIALCWVGMWMGHTSKSGHLAALKTLVFVQIVPWLVIGFCSSMAMGMLMMARFSKAGTSAPFWIMTWWPIVNASLTGFLALVKDAVFVLWARKKLFSSFRAQACRSLSPFKTVTLPVQQPVTAMPPIIPPAPGASS